MQLIAKLMDTTDEGGRSIDNKFATSALRFDQWKYHGRHISKITVAFIKFERYKLWHICIHMHIHIHKDVYIILAWRIILIHGNIIYYDTIGVSIIVRLKGRATMVLVCCKVGKRGGARGETAGTFRRD